MRDNQEAGDAHSMFLHLYCTYVCLTSVMRKSPDLIILTVLRAFIFLCHSVHTIRMAIQFSATTKMREK